MARSALHEREFCISECSHLPSLCKPTGHTPDSRGPRLEIILLIIRLPLCSQLLTLCQVAVR